MDINVYSVKDIKSLVYGNPFFEHNDEVAKRMFGRAVNDERTTIYHYPADYELVKIGIYDDEKGIINKIEFQYLGNGQSFKKEEGNVPRNDRVNTADQAAAPVSENMRKSVKDTTAVQKGL